MEDDFLKVDQELFSWVLRNSLASQLKVLLLDDGGAFACVDGAVNRSICCDNCKLFVVF